MKLFKRNFLKRKMYKNLPRSFQLNLLKHLLPEMDVPRENLVFRSVESVADYRKAFSLLHDVYVEAGYMEPSPSCLRITPHHRHKDACVFIGEYTTNYQEIAVYTSSLFPDSSMGIPMDIAFKKEIDQLRDQGRFVVEAGCLASNPLFRKRDMFIPMLGNKILHYNAEHNFQADDMVMTIHPKHQWFYEDILFFEKLGTVQEFPSVKNNPAIAMRLNLKKARKQYQKVYSNMPMNKSLYHFFCEHCSEEIILSENRPEAKMEWLDYYVEIKEEPRLKKIV